MSYISDMKKALLPGFAITAALSRLGALYPSMTLFLALPMLLLLPMPSASQTGLHVQTFSISNGYPFDKDSIFSTVQNNGGKFRRMGLFNPNTKEWKYLNDSDYSNYL